jgi:hypothetical protein
MVPNGHPPWSLPCLFIEVYCLDCPVAKRLPETIAYVRITHQSWSQGRIEGEVRANNYEWQFQWRFRQGQLRVEPSLGRALIREPLSRFLERFDYQLEAGGDYSFKIRAKL